jgi:HEAT repeat protein
LDGEAGAKTDVRKPAAEALGRFRDPRSRAALVKAIEDDPDWDVYRAAQLALYRMDEPALYADYEALNAKVALAVARKPIPPGGAQKAIRKWNEENPNWQGSWRGPQLEDYAPKSEIERARDSVIQDGTNGIHMKAGGVIEILMEYLRNSKLNYGPENAKPLIIKIGKRALPALQNGVKRGDPILARNCQECINAIHAAQQTSPKTKK